MSTLHPLSEGRGVGVPPKQAPSPTADSKAPSGEGKSSALPEAQETPLSQGSSRTVRFKELFHSGKRKARVKRKSAGQRRGIPAPGARHSAPLSPPQNPAASPPSAGTLAPAPALTPSSQKDPPHTGSGWEPGPHPDPFCRIQSWIPLFHAPKASSREKQETLLLVFLPLAPVPPAPALWSRSPEGGGMLLLSPRPWLKSDPARKNISYRQQNQTKNKAAASEVPVPVPARHLGAGGRRGREGSS